MATVQTSSAGKHSHTVTILPAPGTIDPEKLCEALTWMANQAGEPSHDEGEKARLLALIHEACGT